MLQQAIGLMREGKIDAGARMLQIVIKNPELSNTFRATAYAWLAESKDDLDFKIQCLNRAMDSDPTNEKIQQRLNTLLSVQPPTGQAPVQRPPQLPPSNDPLRDSQPIDIVKPNDPQLTFPTFNNPAAHPPPANPPKPDTSPYQPINLPKTGRLPNMFPETENYSSPTDMQSTQTYPVLPNTNRMPPVDVPQSASPSSYRLKETPRVVGIGQGPNGMGTGIFVTTDGIVATTRYVVGGLQEASVELETGQVLPAQVVRTYPEYDLALLQTNVSLDRVWPPTRVPVISENESFIAVGFSDNPQRGYKRKSISELAHQWIQTSVELTAIRGAGGNAMFDAQNYLIGLLTRNASRTTGLTYGLHILHIYECVRDYVQDRQNNPNSGYCAHCGNMTLAQHFGGFYCESCGAILAGLEQGDRRYRSTPQLLRIYNENLNRACPNCTARVGFHNGKCLRCDYDLDSRRT